MKVHLHIDRLVVDGLGLSTMEGAPLERAISTELGRLLSGQDSSGQGWIRQMRSESLAMLRGDGFAHHAGDSPQQLGSRIAGAVHGSMQRVGNGSQPRKGRG